jgi:hypothetical protein
MEKLVCAKCNSNLIEREEPCKNCGSNKKILMLSFIDKMPEPLEIFKAKAKDKTKNKKKNPVLDIYQGVDLSRNTGEFVNKEREIDKINNYYYEHVETFDGKVIHHCEEKLTDHFGHGSAKFKSKKIQK